MIFFHYYYHMNMQNINNINFLSFIGLFVSNIMCYFIFSQMFYTWENIQFNNTLFMNLSQIFYLILFSFILFIFESSSIFSLYIIFNSFQNNKLFKKNMTNIIDKHIS